MGISEKFLTILHIEDSESDSKIIEQHLNRVGHKAYYQRVNSRADFFHYLRKDRPNLIISDYFIDGLSAIEALEASRDLYPDVAFVLISRQIGEESVADLMKAGVEDVVMKSRLERLTPVIHRILREHETKDKEAKARTIANQAFAAKEQMLAIVSHDIKNPLSAIQLDAQMLIRNASKYPEHSFCEDVKLQANRILKTTDRLKILISDLLDKNRRDDGLASLNRDMHDPIRLIHEVADSCKSLLSEKEITVKIPKIFSHSLISIDRNKLFQVLANLMSNSMKFTPAGGEITLGFEEEKSDYIFSVKDSGPGLSKTAQERVFDKYWTGGTGTGLGLFICKTVVEAHGGQIMARNAEGEGAFFSFSIPKPLSKIEFSTHPNAQRTDPRSRIVVIDDDEDLREVISWALSREGFSVRSFRDPKDALVNLREGRLFPQLILVDYHMDGMKGGEFLRLKDEISDPQIRSCPVVMISATPKEIEKEVSHTLYNEIITKPFDLEGLVEKIKRNVH
jgi:signal transduction histidine kinase